MGIAGAIRQVAAGLSYPAAASLYRRMPAGTHPPALLKFLGIAHPSYRTDFYTLHELVRRIGVEGGVLAECGVYRGATLLGMANTLAGVHASDWHVVGFDSFAGFPEPGVEDALPDGTYHSRTQRGAFGDASCTGLSRRIRRLGLGDRVTLVKGYFRDTLSTWQHEFALVHLDCNLYESYRSCLEFFYPRLRPGGYMVFDDYDYSAGVYPGAQKAIDEFLTGKPERIRYLPEAPARRYFITKL